MTPPKIPADRLSRLVPRLASTYEAEVIATVRAIDRTLKAAGADFNDLGTFLSTRPQRAPDPPSYSHPSPWRRLDQEGRLEALRRLIGISDLSPWELTFVTNIHGRLKDHPEARLSFKQVAVLDRLLTDHGIQEGGQ